MRHAWRLYQNFDSIHGTPGFWSCRLCGRVRNVTNESEPCLADKTFNQARAYYDAGYEAGVRASRWITDANGIAHRIASGSWRGFKTVCGLTSAGAAVYAWPDAERCERCAGGR